MGQGMHSYPETLYSPIAQSTQSVIDVLPVVVVLLPAAQFMHVAEGVELYVPMRHGVHKPPEVLYSPAAHGKHGPPDTLDCPAGQG
jgi:hypothetical protein